MKKSFFFCLFALFSLLSIANPDNCESTCPQPANVATSSKSSDAISFDWDDCSGGCSGYEVRFVRLSDHYTSSWHSTSVSNYTFSELQAGEYEFHFRTICGGEVSSFIVIEDSIWN